ncbi:unnamed protein product [Rotaria socialis]|uniref:K Homology domain-containing protein n=1 Tax=Rotaria socialis TaxID=392032 RepID=A0A820VWP6_9BILA|nr:unnamed protein product [Rotaria socialis]CAF4507066.1 unnamed protein product [Rotaria socialis]
MKSTSRTSSITDQTVKHNSKQDLSTDLTDVSIISVGLSRYQHHNHRMLTDDEEDIEDETSDDEDGDDDDEIPSPFISHSHLSLNNNNNDDIDIGPIDPDTQAKLAAILEATGITNSPIPEDFWRDQQVVRLLTSSVTNNFNGLHEIANALSPSTLSSQNEKKSKLANKDSGVLLRACVNNDLHTVEKILQTKNIKEYLHDINEDGDSILSLACSNGYTDLVELILRTIPDIAVDDRGNKQDCTPLMEACNAGHFDIVELLIKNKANVNIQSTSGNTALHYAAGGGYVDIVRLLLKHGAKVEETNENGHTPLMEAAGGGHVEVTQILLDHGAGTNNQSKDKNGNKTDELHTALMEACMDGHVQVAKLLLDHGADVNMPPDSYESPLTLSACGGHFELASLLIERGANLEEVNDEGYTPLMEASREGHDEIVNLLVSKGAKVNRTTEEAQETALTLACAGGFLEVVKILLSNGADINLGQSTPLMEASQEGHIELVQYLIENGVNVNQATRAGDTALGYACESGHTEVAEILLNAGAHIDEAENEGRTPLMKASRVGHTCTVRYLISKGADVNRSTITNDATPLSLACAGGHFELATILLLNGADPNHLLKDRSNCLIEAAKGGHTAIVQLLLEYPKSILNCTINSVETNDDNGNDDDDDDEENLTVTMPNSFPLPSPPPNDPNLKADNDDDDDDDDDDKSNEINNSSFTLLDRLEKIVPRNILEVLKTVEVETNELHGNIDTTDMSTYSWPTTDRLPSPINDETSSNNADEAKKLYLLEQLQHVEKELHDKAQQHLKLNQEYRQQVNEYINSNPCSTSNPAIITKKKRTTSSSSTSSSSSSSKPDDQTNSSTILPSPSQTINFFSTSSIESDPCSSTQSSHHHHHHSKIKKSFNRQISKYDRRLEHYINENQSHFDEMNIHLKNLKLISSSSSTESTPTKTPMRINTDPKKALEHLRQLASYPSALERIQTLANNPNLMKEIQKFANQKPFIEQLKTLQQTTTVEKTTTSATQDSTVTTSQQCQNLTIDANESPLPGASSSNPRHSICCAEHSSQLINSSSTVLSHLRFQNRIDVDCETESNHDTALTLACAGGHEELVLLLLQRNANIEHRDKKGFTSLILAATAGHASIVLRLIEHGANIEAQSERTKDTALSLACSGGRQDVVEVLLKNGANREHRNVSDYTALSLAASGGYVTIIKLLLSYGAEINSRTGSKLGITPLMLASMNGHVAAVKLLLDMGADINAQIETNRNTALTLACFQGRAEVVSLLVDRKANIEHRAKTGLTPLMESASGGYVDVGRVLLERGADVNALPVPTSKDTALTIAADKGHHKFVELLLLYGATIDVRNKKGATPLWLACNGGHLEVVQLLITRFANPDSSDSRKVSCLMAAFRKGHIKVVKYLVRQVRQFPSDTDCRRLINTITDKDLLKKCQTCMDQIMSAKERQAAEANKAANNLLKEIESEKSREQTKKEAAAKKREKRKAKKKGKQQTTTTTDEPLLTKVEENETPEIEEHTEVSSSNVVIVDDDLRLKMVKTDNEHKPTSPERTTKQVTNNKKKTNTMSRKIERHQENLVSKIKQESSITDDGWQEVIGKQKKITISYEQYTRIIERCGSNFNVLREMTGASIDVENKRSMGDKTILIKGNGDSIKHAHQLITALLKNTETDLASLVPSKNKSRSTTIVSNHDNESESIKTQRANTGPRLQNNESTFFETSSTSRSSPRSLNPTTKKTSSAITTRSTSSSAPIKTPKPIASTGTTWINSNRSNRAISSSSTNNSTTVNLPNWTHPKTSSSHNKTSHSTHYSYVNSMNQHRTYLNNQQPTSPDTNQASPSKPIILNSYSMPPLPSLLVAAPSSKAVATGEYNPFASNILTTSIVDVLTKTKESSNSSGTINDESALKMNFANVAKMNVPTKQQSHQESIGLNMNESTASSIQTDPKIAPGYRGLSTATPIIIPPTNFDSLSPTSQINRAPGSNRIHQSISPSLNKISLDQNGQAGSSTASSTSSSPSSLKQQTNQFIQPQPLFPTLEQQKPFGPIGSHRTPISTDDIGLQMPSKFSPNNPPPMYQQTLMNNSSYSNRSSLNPSAPEFQGPLSSNIMNIARLMEQQQKQQQVYSNIPATRSCQQSDIEAIQHVQNQVVHYYHLQTNQPHLVQQQLPPPPPLATTLQIANMLASRGHLPQDTNQAAALVANYYYKNFLSRTQPTNNNPLSPNVNTNSDDIPITSVDPTVIISNSNHSTGPSLSSTSAGSDQKMVPAAIGSERKRHMPTSTTVVPPMVISDWSSVSKQPYPYPQQQTRDYPR